MIKVFAKMITFHTTSQTTEGAIAEALERAAEHGLKNISAQLVEENRVAIGRWIEIEEEEEEVSEEEGYTAEEEDQYNNAQYAYSRRA